MKTIEIPDNMYQKLMELAKEYATQDTRSTGYPVLFQVETQQRQYRAENCGDNYCWIDTSNFETEIYSVDDMADIIDPNDEVMTNDYQSLVNDEGEIDSLEFSIFMTEHFPDFRETWYDYEPIYKNCFFTAKGCNQHIAQNDYHYREPRSYAIHGWRNPDIDLISNLLLHLGKECK